MVTTSKEKGSAETKAAPSTPAKGPNEQLSARRSPDGERGAKPLPH